MLVVTKSRALIHSAKSCTELCRTMCAAKQHTAGRSRSAERQRVSGNRGVCQKETDDSATTQRYGRSRAWSLGQGRDRRHAYNQAAAYYYEQQRYHQNTSHSRFFRGEQHMSKKFSCGNSHVQQVLSQRLQPSFETVSAEEARHFEEEQLHTKFRSMRHWEYTDIGKQVKRKMLTVPRNSVTFTIMSYNVLAQDLLEQHMYLYKNVPSDVLDWQGRSRRILREIRESKADVLCLQEIQASHFDGFYCPHLKRLGYHGIFKKRTGDKPDGCAVFYRTSKFKLHSHRAVDYYKPSVKILNRDNIGLIVLLAPHSWDSKSGDPPLLCVANTHLLYNPRRHDVKLAQLQVLFAELDHIAHDGTEYHPVLLMGDFNLSPESSVYRFVTTGSLDYGGLFQNTELIPRKLNITDQCQHLDVVEKRQKDGSDVTEDSTFASGALSHKLKFSSVYPHILERLRGSPREVTTHQDDWVTVDYIFYSRTRNTDDGKKSLLPLKRLGLLSGDEMDSLGGIPSLAAPSDHVPLVSTFLWQW